MDKEKIEYSLYLVTDSTPAILGDQDLYHVVEEALKGGVTIVQYRDKDSDTGLLISTAKKLHAITKKYSVPLLINDRVDIALAIGCEGVHIGQDDMDLETTRRLLGPDAVIGVTTSTEEEAIKAMEGGADYLGVGTVFSTSTKKDVKHIIGPAGVRRILQSVGRDRTQKPRVVCIGGLGPRNVQRVLIQASPPEWPIDGVAVVSAIMSADDPQLAAQLLVALISSPGFNLHSQQTPDAQSLVKRIPGIVKVMLTKKPISHNMTNLVVQNFAANVALCIGASPIMSSYAAEAADLANLDGGLVINAGTVTPEGLKNYVEAVQAYNLAKRPVVLDPVGAGATAIRRAALRTLLNAGHFTVIKGNQVEIVEVVSAHDPNSWKRIQQRGVDSTPGTRQPWELATLVRELAVRESCVVVMTGATDYISDGTTTLLVKNGHEYLGQVTGTGCVLGTAISVYLAARDDGDNVLGAVLAAILHFEIAAEIAAVNRRVSGPGTFVPAFLDTLVSLRTKTEFIVGAAKVELWTEI